MKRNRSRNMISETHPIRNQQNDIFNHHYLDDFTKSCGWEILDESIDFETGDYYAEWQSPNEEWNLVLMLGEGSPGSMRTELYIVKSGIGYEALDTPLMHIYETDPEWRIRGKWMQMKSFIESGGENIPRGHITTEGRLRKIIRKRILEGWFSPRKNFGRFRSLEHFLLTVIWPCYQDGKDAEYCYRHALGAEEMQILRANAEDILGAMDNPEFLAYAYEIAQMCLGEE